MNIYVGGKLYEHQTELRLRFDCGDIDGALNARVHYRKPNGDVGSFSGTVEDTTPTGHVYFDLTLTGQFSVNGEWRFWPKIGFTSGSAPGEAIRVKIYNEGE